MSQLLVFACGRADEKLVSLTFDDGPGDVTPAILDALAAHRARATFFVLGRSLAGREDVVRRTVAEGHELGNHTFSHPHPARSSGEELRDELARAAERIALVAGAAPRLVRPPYGEDAIRFASIAADLGYGPTVLWSVNPLDWAEPPPETIVERSLAALHPGAIVDLHDGFGTPRRGVGRQGTVVAVRELLPALAEHGYRCVTVSELLAASVSP